MTRNATAACSGRANRIGCRRRNLDFPYYRQEYGGGEEEAEIIFADLIFRTLWLVHEVVPPG
jgi:hypothetical protein